MAATTKRVLVPCRDIHSSVRCVRHLCSSSSDPNASLSEPQTRPSFSSNLNEEKASLQQEHRKDRPQIPPRPLSSSNSELARTPPSKTVSLEEIRQNLAEFPLRSAATPSTSTGRFISFEELNKRNVIPSSRDSAAASNFTAKPSADTTAARKLSLDSIRESLRQIRATTPAGKYRLKVKALENTSDFPTIHGGSGGFPSSIRAKESMGSADKVGSAATSTKFLKSYDYPVLGNMLRNLRPEKKGKWFSLQELRDRLAKLKEIEENNSTVIGGLTFTDLRETLSELKISEEEKSREKAMRRLSILSQLGGTPNFMLLPPKRHLVEKYFHPDHMSAAEKLKLELKKVRDEFKMSESDCGSTRVQVAELTTKIKYLSTALQKKDKHSRKGLQAMVQRRKKMLKYLRRTDWDSYTMVLSRLGLRDNPVTRKKA